MNQATTTSLVNSARNEPKEPHPKIDADRSRMEWRRVRSGFSATYVVRCSFGNLGVFGGRRFRPVVVGDPSDVCVEGDTIWTRLLVMPPYLSLSSRFGSARISRISLSCSRKSFIVLCKKGIIMKVLLAIALMAQHSVLSFSASGGLRPKSTTALNNIQKGGSSSELGLPCVDECALESFPNLPPSVHPGVLSGQAQIDLLKHAKENGTSVTFCFLWMVVSDIWNSFRKRCSSSHFESSIGFVLLGETRVIHRWIGNLHHGDFEDSGPFRERFALLYWRKRESKTRDLKN